MNILRRSRVWALAAAFALVAAAIGTIGPVQRAVSQAMVQITSLAGTEQISLNYPCTVSCFVTTSTFAGYTQAQAGNNPENALVGGDAATNLWQRGTSVALASPAAAAYTADRWFAWGGTNTPITVTKQTGAADITQAFGASMRVNKPSGAGVVQICIAQQIETVNSYRFQGNTAEFDFHAKAGAGFSAAASNLAIYVMTGTGTDEASANGAFSLNAGGGSATPWTGPAILGGASGYLIPISTTWTRYGVAVPIPLTATEIMVAVCYTPVGTGGATDWFEVTGEQLVPNSSLATAAGSAGVILANNDARARSFHRRPQQYETDLQQRYFQVLNEPASGFAIGASGVMSSTTNCAVTLALGTTMRATPTITFTGTALSTSTWRIQDSTTSTLASTFLVQGAGNTANTVNLNATLTTASTAGFGCQLQGAGGGSVLNIAAEL